MSFEAEFRLEENIYRINGLSLDISQEVDELGRPSSASRGGIIKIEMDSLKDDVLTDWAMKASKSLNGTITYYRSDEYAKLKEVNFEKGFCIELREKYLGAIAADKMVTLLTISAEKVMIGTAEMNNQWP